MGGYVNEAVIKPTKVFEFSQPFSNPSLISKKNKWEHQSEKSPNGIETYPITSSKTKHQVAPVQPSITKFQKHTAKPRPMQIK